jgi:hypothetical protein
MTGLGALPAFSQTVSPVARADMTAAIGWLVLQDHDDSSPYSDNDWHNSFFGGGGAGWYWTDHLKTELDLGAGTAVQAYRVTPVTINGRTHYVSAQSRLARRMIGVSQQYQFFRNVWFHPHIAAGANVTWEKSTDGIHPIVIYDPVLPPRVVEGGRTDGPKTDVTVRPFLATGFKAYVTQHGFFRTDLRVAFRSGADEVLLRIGFGVDF